MTHEHATDSAQPIRRKRHIVLKLFLVLLLLLVAGAGVLFYLWSTEPPYVKRHRAFLANTAPEDLNALSQSMQNKLLSLSKLDIDDEIAKLRASGATPAQVRKAMLATIGSVRTITLTLDEINAWIRTEMPQHLEKADMKLPRGVSDVGVAIEGENLVAFGRLDYQGINQVISFVFTLTFTEDKATVKLLHVRTGQLNVPQAAIRSQAGDDPNDVIAQIARSFDGTEFDPVIDMSVDDVRKPRIIAMKVHPTSIELTVRMDAK